MLIVNVAHHQVAEWLREFMKYKTKNACKFVFFSHREIEPSGLLDPR